MDRFISFGVFVAAAAEGSLAAAARKFGLSPSMASKHVSALEAELGVRLMQRSTRKLTLTDAGRAYYLRCQRILEEVDEANREASDAQIVVRGPLRVAAPVTFGAMHLGGVVARYLDQHPEVTIDVRLDDQYVDLLAGGIDVAIRIGKLLDSDLVARRLAPCRMVFCAAPEFLTRHRLKHTLDDIRQAPRLVFSNAVSQGDWTATDAKGETHTFDGPIRLSSDNTQMLLAAALEGAGITYGPSFVFGEHLARGDLVTLLPKFQTVSLAIHAVYPSARHVTLKLRRFIDHLVASFGDTPPWPA
ncbi:DNA-binding transcriptional LysR family regulator [Rhodanobacter sp. ANJX3]|uniref:LysR family transcriptional regulator n=1 Tax=unclassified Rhodanobacter TaxID=2621553 RepID=UPI0015C8D5A0|nr:MULTISPECIES: LysR family transcriptional regulator [unclassified Rhodanobacter]MBB5357463.1 DNA-binding transcriptional LysR family regulator [Rhodanobacter sp. ANJX3]NYE27512.1 DNA-binding transcriptional LysR family regulator [Rhodanobacter sp. K2T2]